MSNPLRPGAPATLLERRPDGTVTYRTVTVARWSPATWTATDPATGETITSRTVIARSADLPLGLRPLMTDEDAAAYAAAATAAGRR